MQRGHHALTKDRLKAILSAAADSLSDQASEFTPDTAQTEWNIAHHLSIAVQKHFADLDCDVDLRKPGYGGRRPDIVFHERGVHRLNRLVVEVKRNGTTRSRITDLNKIRTHWFGAPLRYRFGAYVNVGRGKPNEVVVLENPYHVRKRAEKRRLLSRLNRKVRS